MSVTDDHRPEADPLAYGPTGIRCGCGKDAHSNLVPCRSDEPTRKWTDIDPKDAGDIDLVLRLDITAPLNENGERCPWPWEPQQLVGAPMGQFHCSYCGAMVMAGLPHIDYAPCGRCNDTGVDPERAASESYGDVVREVPVPCIACQLTDGEATR
ncbi:hypothetical protein [Streptomyces sp. NPDC088794]|uniref:hypothetical protein n=1 Tax=Streptomyces sp. NPDC088794 TaxID=3365902 RepID=UPI003800BA56